jgi:uncharacterized membrane protein
LQGSLTAAPRGRLPAIAPATFWAPTLALSGLIVINTVPYYSLGEDFDFLLEKGSLARDPIWRAAFFHHITGSLACLIVGPVLLSRRALRASVALHRWLGWTYVLAVLCVAAPSGLYLAVFAKGGLLGQTGFVVAGLAWFAATWLGLRAIQQRRLATHLTWMVRSYALAWSAISFRMIQVALYALGVGADTNYVASLWLSLVISVLLGEWGAAHLRGTTRALPTSNGATR